MWGRSANWIEHLIANHKVYMRKTDSNPRSPDRGQHFSRRETSSIPYPLTTRPEIVHQAKSG
jgi:hypothetical protein